MKTYSIELTEGQVKAVLAALGATAWDVQENETAYATYMDAYWVVSKQTKVRM